MNVQIDIDTMPAVAADVPGRNRLRRWLSEALSGRCEEAELAVRIVTEEEGRLLNARYRGQDRATNVLSFPGQDLGAGTPRSLGDLVICADVVCREARAQGKAPEAHWAHMCVHGALHLLGFDHQGEAEARKMEALEVEIMSRLGYQDPYRAEA